jgi:hypothetical protein
MPIRPEMRDRYPADWKAIRTRILERAGNRCEWCGVANYARIHRNLTDGDLWLPELPSGEVPVGYSRAVRMVLTIAHVHNPDPADCRPDNLAALCNRCHNRHDAPMRRMNATETRRQKRARHQPALELVG